MPRVSQPGFPALYSFRRCPYAMRARLAIVSAGIAVELREVQLKNKPLAMLQASPKATVPVLVLKNGKVIDESLDIMQWALNINDPDNWLEFRSEAFKLTKRNDSEFKHFLDRYKYADRYPEKPAAYYRSQGELFLHELEQRLQKSAFLCGPRFGFADAAIAPFIRQFAAVDNPWFASSPYPALRKWLQDFLRSALFNNIMPPYQAWNPIAPAIIFGSGLMPLTSQQ
ncbi:MAG: glutathione S-transferase [Gammaproteobacteria bacterium]